MSSHLKQRSRRRGFTLVEILLVVAIILIVSGVTIPSFMRSYQAANLRSAARTVVTAGKYARNMAVLQQRQVTIFFDSESGNIQVVALERAAGRQVDAFLDAQRHRSDPDAETYQAQVLRATSLPERVRIVDFTAPSRLQEADGVYWVNYFPSGVSDSFSLRIADEQRRSSVRLHFDHLSGTVRTEYD
jgi:prepilin-type N-terminal cleavage/methylation domain-containing protein